MRRDLILVSGVGLLARIPCAIYFRGDTTGVDVTRYLDQARSLALDHSFTYNGQPTAVNGPLFPLLLSLFWTDSFHAFLAQLFFVLLGTLTACLTYLLARKVLDRKWSVIAGLCIALGPMSIRYSAMLLTETLFTFLVTLALWLWSEKRWASSGLVFGLSMLTRPTTLIFVLFLPFLIRKRQYALVTLAAIMVITPWAVRNAVVFGRLIPVAASGYGTNILIGTIDLDYRRPMWDQVTCTTLVDGVTGTESHRDAVLMRRAIGIIKASPAAWMKARVKQYPLLYADFGQYLHNGNRAWKLAVEITFLLGNLSLLVLTILGLYRLWGRWQEFGYLVYFPLYLMLIHLPMWVEARYSLPMAPEMVILGLIFLSHILPSEFCKPAKNRGDLGSCSL